MMITKIDYQEALNVQTACNLSGLLHSFVAILKKIPADKRRGHPICRLFAEQVMHLSGGIGDNETYKIAYEAAKKETR